MDAVKYLKESERMCDFYEGCEGCEIKERVGKNDGCIGFENDDPEAAVAIVEKWSAEHHIRTKAEYIAEKLREIGYTVDDDELKKCCPPHASGNYIGYEKACGGECDICEEWWNEEWEEK